MVKKGKGLGELILWMSCGHVGGRAHRQFGLSSTSSSSSQLGSSASHQRQLCLTMFKHICGWALPPMSTWCHSHNEFSHAFPVIHHSSSEVTRVQCWKGQHYAWPWLLSAVASFPCLPSFSLFSLRWSQFQHLDWDV